MISFGLRCWFTLGNINQLAIWQERFGQTFVLVPIGGNVNVKLAKIGQTRIEDGSRIQMLASFLPGGFKNRWDFNLW